MPSQPPSLLGFRCQEFNPDITLVIIFTHPQLRGSVPTGPPPLFCSAPIFTAALPLFLNPDYPFIRHFSSKNGK